jgi:hypothetical protein
MLKTLEAKRTEKGKALSLKGMGQQLRASDGRGQYTAPPTVLSRLAQ